MSSAYEFFGPHVIEIGPLDTLGQPAVSSMTYTSPVYVACGGLMTPLGRCDLCGASIESSSGRCANLIQIEQG